MALACGLVILVWSIGDKLCTIPMRTVQWIFCSFMSEKIVSQAFASSWPLKTDNTVRVQNKSQAKSQRKSQKGCAIPNKMLLTKEHIDHRSYNAILKNPHCPPLSPQCSLNRWHCMVFIVVAKSLCVPLPWAITGESVVRSLLVLHFYFIHTIIPHCPILIYSLQRMVSFCSILLPCFLATTSYTFTIKPNAQSPAFTHHSNVSSSTSCLCLVGVVRVDWQFSSHPQDCPW